MSARMPITRALALAALFLAAICQAADRDVELRNAYWSASARSGAGDYEKAVALYERVLQQAPKVWFPIARGMPAGRASCGSASNCWRISTWTCAATTGPSLS
jgi:hypothetical protein